MVVVVGKTAPGMEDVLVVGTRVRAPVVLGLVPLDLEPEGILTGVESPVVVVLVVSPVVEVSPVVSPMGLKPVSKFLSASEKFVSRSLVRTKRERERERKRNRSTLLSVRERRWAQESYVENSNILQQNVPFFVHFVTDFDLWTLSLYCHDCLSQF